MAETPAERWPVLTVRQPWALMFTIDIPVPKRTENRGWCWAYRGPMWLHAGARSGWEPAGANDPLVRAAWEHHVRHIPGWPGLPWSDIELTRKTTLMPFKAVTALVRVVGCHDFMDCEKFGPLSTRAGFCTPWSRAGQFHIEVADVRPLPEPVPCDGKQGVWRLPEDVERRAREQLEVVSA